MKFIWLSIKIGLVITLSSTTLIGNQGFAQIKPAYSNNQIRKQIKFSLPAPPPGKPPGGRTRGGGRRGSYPDIETNLTALVPFTKNTLKLAQTEYIRENVWGFTTSLHPQFFFHVPFSNKYPFSTEFVLQDEESKKIVYQSVVKLPNQPGIIAVSLPETVKPLEENKTYRFFFNIYSEPEKPIPLQRVEGVIRRVKLSEELTQKIKTAEPRKQVELYASQGIWFNAINLLAKLRQQQPKNQQFIDDWKSLLESIGLGDISKQPLINQKSGIKENLKLYYRIE